MKTAFIFSGQGAQYPGMGKDLYEHHEAARKIFDSITLDFSIKELCFGSDSDRLNDTQYTQAAIFAHSMACAALLEEAGIYGDVCAGLSLGEYSALCYAQSFTLQEGASILRVRGRLMKEALPAGTTAMSAILMLDETSILKACEAVKDIGICEIANYNCPTQIVITGEKKAVEAAGELCLHYGARRVIPLKVSGAFHCSLLEKAGEELRDELSLYDLKPAKIPVYHNISGQREKRPLIELLAQQISHPVKLQQTIEQMLEDGVDTFIEVGPGKAVSGFVKKCTKNHDVQILHVEDEESLKECIQTLKG